MSIGIAVGNGISPVFLRPKGGIKITYLVHDLFLTVDAAPITSPRNAEPGPGVMTTVDTGNLVSIVDNELIFAIGGTYNDPVIHYGAQTKAVGLSVGVVVYQLDAGAGALSSDIGWDSDALADLRELRFYLSATGNIFAQDGIRFAPNPNIDIGDYVGGTVYQFILVALDTQMVWLAKGGIYTNWTMLQKGSYVSQLGATVYPGYNSYNRESRLKEFNVAVLPGPWNSDSVVGALNNGDTVTSGRALAVLDAFFQYSPLTFNQLRLYFASTGATVGIERSGEDYWLWQDLGSNRYWFVKLEWSGVHLTHALTYSLIKDGPTLADTTTETLQDAGNVWEYAFNIDNAGGVGVTEWVGNFHGRDPESSIALSVDGTPVTLADGESASGSVIVVTRESDWTADAGADTHIADCTTIYTMRPSTGLDVQIVTNWNTPTWPEQNGHMAMWPELKSIFDRGIMVSYPSVIHLDQWAGVNISSDQISTNGICGFENGGNWGMLLTTLDERTRNTYFQEREFLMKLYTNEVATSGVQFGSRYQVEYFGSTDFLENV